MKNFDIKEILSWDPCYAPSRYLPESWNGNVLDILEHSSISFIDKLWVICRNELVSDKLMRLFAVFAYRQTLNWVKNPDPISVEAVNVAERHVNGNVSDYELAKVRYEATETERLAKTSLSRAEAWSARSAAMTAAWYGDTAAKYATDAAIQVALWAGGIEAERELTKVLQDKLREMLIAGIETGDTK